jgi:hypothetical protein
MRVKILKSHVEYPDGGGSTTYVEGSFYIIDSPLVDRLIAEGKAITEEELEALNA